LPRAAAWLPEFKRGQLVIDQPGRIGKFVSEVAQVTYPGFWPEAAGQEVLIVTERAKFRVQGGRLHLVDLAPGIDLKRDILDRMASAPEICGDPPRYAGAVMQEVPEVAM